MSDNIIHKIKKKKNLFKVQEFLFIQSFYQKIQNYKISMKIGIKETINIYFGF